MTIKSKVKANGNNILILTYWSYSEALIQTYTLPYVRMIRKIIPSESSIYLLTLEKQSSDRTQIRRFLEAEGIQWIPFNYKRFGGQAILSWIRNVFTLVNIIKRENISVIHAWCTPAGAIGYILSVLTGRKLVLDSFEPHAEAMVETGTWRKNRLAFRLLFALEKKQAEMATHVIATTEGMRQYAFTKYGVAIKNFYVKPAGVDLDLFNLTKVKKSDSLASLGFIRENVICGYAGKFGGMYLEDEVFDFFAICASHWGKRFRVLLLTNLSSPEIIAYSKRAGLNPEIVISRFIAHQQIPEMLGACDFALTPNKPVPSKRFGTPIKNGEYWAMGLPVVITADISVDSSIIEKYQIGALLHNLNEAAYLEAVRKIDKLIGKKETRERIREVAVMFRGFDQAEKIYRIIYGFQ